MNPDSPTGPRAARDTQFRAALLVSDLELSATATVGYSSCNIAVRPPVFRPDDGAPEVRLELRGGAGTSGIGRAETDEGGRLALSDLRQGVQVLRVRTRDGLYNGRLVLDLSGRRTNLIGAIVTDRADHDRDGDTSEGLLVIDVLPDADGNGASDSGEWSRWIFGESDGLVFHHRAAGTTEEVTLNSSFEEVEVVVFDDRDGDLIADADDPDADGDGVPDGEEGASLPCPGFSHDLIFAESSKHKDFTCDRCHQVQEESNPLRCDDCHTLSGRSWEETPLDAPEPHFLRGCEMCHRADQPWADVPGENGELHEAFPLIGKHNETNCYSCHEAGKAKPPKLCENCHLGEAGPDHFDSSCETCHEALGWKPAFNTHDSFPLTDGHDKVACDQCHTPPNFEGVSTECRDCHLEDAPTKHTQPGFVEQACDDCHSITVWTEYRYPHTQWLLEGLHASTECMKCHEAPDTYEGNATFCEGCHQTPNFPDHANFSQDCNGCHTPERWVPSTAESIDHSIFPLENKHAEAACGSCHEDGLLPHPPQDCTSCHMADRPTRHEGVFDGDCADCHQTSGFADLNPPYEHTATFVLEGVHATTPCSSCHETEYTANTQCVSCHSADEPADHYGQECETCHTAENWNPTGEMNHHSVDPTSFPLSFGHANLLCSQCHVNGFEALPRNCENCHANDTPLGHATAACDGCHTAGSWNNPSQPPPNDFHPLTGAHDKETCVDCHGAYQVGSGFATPSPGTACVGCHNLPGDHPLSVGTTPCDSCHSVTAWVPAAGGHEGSPPTSPFPYASWAGAWFPDGGNQGTHHDARQCNKCHTQGGDYAFFSCTSSCHRNQSSLNSEHKNGVDQGSDPKKQFHLFHFSPTAQNNPPNEGGATWPSGHVGCVNRNCHPRGRKP